MWARLWSAFCFTVVCYIQNWAFLWILSTAEICPIIQFVSCMIDAFSHWKSSHNLVFFPHPVRWLITCNKFHHYHNIFYFSFWKETVKPAEQAARWPTTGWFWEGYVLHLLIKFILPFFAWNISIIFVSDLIHAHVDYCQLVHLWKKLHCLWITCLELSNHFAQNVLDFFFSSNLALPLKAKKT